MIIILVLRILVINILAVDMNPWFVMITICVLPITVVLMKEVVFILPLYVIADLNVSLIVVIRPPVVKRAISAVMMKISVLLIFVIRKLDVGDIP